MNKFIVLYTNNKEGEWGISDVFNTSYEAIAFSKYWAYTLIWKHYQ